MLLNVRIPKVLQAEVIYTIYVINVCPSTILNINTSNKIWPSNSSDPENLRINKSSARSRSKYHLLDFLFNIKIYFKLISIVVFFYHHYQNLFSLIVNNGLGFFFNIKYVFKIMSSMTFFLYFMIFIWVRTFYSQNQC